MNFVTATLNKFNPRPAPARFMPRFAELHGVEISPMLTYCSQLNSGERLPRGLDKRCEGLRSQIITAIKKRATPEL